MYQTLIIKLTKEIGSLKTLGYLFPSMDESLAQLKHIYHYDHLDHHAIQKQLAQATNLKKLKKVTGNLASNLLPKRNDYTHHLYSLGREAYWKELEANNAAMTEKQRQKVRGLRDYFLSISDIGLYRLPTRLLLLKIDILRKQQVQIHRFIEKILSTSPSATLTNSFAKLWDSGNLINDIFNEIIKLHINVLLSKVELLQHAPFYIDDPLPYAISVLEKADIQNHGLPYYSWAPKLKISSHLAEQALNLISSHGSGSELIRLDNAMIQKKSDNDNRLFKLITKRHSDVRYSTVCPSNVAIYLELKPPRLPWLMQGAKRRYDFFKQEWIALQTMNALASEVQSILHKKTLGEQSYVLLHKKIKELSQLLREHKERMNAQQLQATGFNKLFRAKTLAFQQDWENNLLGVKSQVTDIQLKVLERIMLDAHEIRKNYVEKNEVSSQTCQKIMHDTFTEILADTGSDLVAPQPRQLEYKNRFDQLKKKKDYIFRITLPVKNAPAVFQESSHSGLASLVSEFIQKNELNKAFEYIQFAFFSQEEMGVHGYTVRLSDIEQIEKTLLAKMNDVIILSVNEPQPNYDYQQLIALFEKWVGRDAAKNNCIIQKIWDTKLHASRAMTDCLVSISDAIITYKKIGVWHWPIEADMAKTIMQADKELAQKIITEKSLSTSFPLIRSICQLMSECKKNNPEMHQSLLAIHDFLYLKFSTYAALPDCKPCNKSNEAAPEKITSNRHSFLSHP